MSDRVKQEDVSKLPKRLGLTQKAKKGTYRSFLSTLNQERNPLRPLQHRLLPVQARAPGG
jgi:hypothetical protein